MTCKETNRKNEAHAPPSWKKRDRQCCTLRSNLRLPVELSARHEVATNPEGPEDPPCINSPQDIHNLLGPEMSVLAQRVIYQENVSSSMLRPEEVFRPAAIESTPNIIVSRNHPSKDPTPSPEDLAVTKELAEAENCWASTCWTI